MKSRKEILVFAAAFVLAATACSASPVGAAREWLNANLNYQGTKILERTCQSYQATMMEAGLLSSAFALLPQALIGVEIETEGDVSGLKFSVVAQDGNFAQVHVEGEMRIAAMAFAQAFPVNETWQMVKEDGRWKWCGLAQ